MSAGFNRDYSRIHVPSFCSYIQSGFSLVESLNFARRENGFGTAPLREEALKTSLLHFFNCFLLASSGGLKKKRKEEEEGRGGEEVEP